MAQISANVKEISLPAMVVDICKVQAVAETVTKIGSGVQSSHVQSSRVTEGCLCDTLGLQEYAYLEDERLS